MRGLDDISAPSELGMPAQHSPGPQDGNGGRRGLGLPAVGTVHERRDEAFGGGAPMIASEVQDEGLDRAEGLHELNSGVFEDRRRESRNAKDGHFALAARFDGAALRARPA